MKFSKFFLVIRYFMLCLSSVSILLFSWDRDFYMAIIYLHATFLSEKKSKDKHKSRHSKGDSHVVSYVPDITIFARCR